MGPKKNACKARLIGKSGIELSAPRAPWCGSTPKLPPSGGSIGRTAQKITRPTCITLNVKILSPDTSMLGGFVPSVAYFGPVSFDGSASQDSRFRRRTHGDRDERPFLHGVWKAGYKARLIRTTSLRCHRCCSLYEKTVAKHAEMPCVRRNRFGIARSASFMFSDDRARRKACVLSGKVRNASVTFGVTARRAKSTVCWYDLPRSKFAHRNGQLPESTSRTAALTASRAWP